MGAGIGFLARRWFHAGLNSLVKVIGADSLELSLMITRHALSELHSFFHEGIQISYLLFREEIGFRKETFKSRVLLFFGENAVLDISTILQLDQGIDFLLLLGRSILRRWVHFKLIGFNIRPLGQA